MKFHIETHGCKLNTADSQQLAREFLASGFEFADDGVAPDVFVVNSCTVTSTADRKARQAVSSAKRRFPGALVVATGCYAERDLATVGALESVDLALNNRQKPVIVQSIAERLGVAFTPCTAGDSAPLEAALLGRTRASVKIQEGCNQVCAYCIVPKVRGRERSIPAGEIVGQVNRLGTEGCLEVVLTGTQLGTYGFDLASSDVSNLPGVLRSVVTETDIPRVRVSSLQPLEITDDLLEIWEGSAGRLCPHFHIPLQSGSDAVLGRMRRRYTGEQFVEAVERVRAAVPGCAVTTDVICGFPGESAEDHSATMRVIKQIQFADAHVFPYSERPGTSAARFNDHVDVSLRAERSAEVRQLIEQHALEFRQGSVGQVRPVLWERKGSGGLTDNYLRVRSEGARKPEATVGEAQDKAVDTSGRVSFVNGSVASGSSDSAITFRPITTHRIEDVKLTGVGEDGVMAGTTLT